MPPRHTCPGPCDACAGRMPCTCAVREVTCRQCSGSGWQTRTHYIPRECPKTMHIRSHNPDCAAHGTDDRWQ